VCDHSAGRWWRSGQEYYPLHDRCVTRLVELWSELDTTVEPMASTPARRTGAYARRLATTARHPATPPVLTSGASRDGGSPFFRPGMSAGAPWVACTLTMASLMITPCADNKAHAQRVAANYAALARAGQPAPAGADIAGTWIVGPDGTVTPVWGQVVAPGEALPWELLDRLSAWADCRECGTRMWPGRWRGRDSGRCADCLRPVSPRPVWPADAPCFEVDPLTLPVKKTKRRDTTRTVD
jgi:hypothetical protein